MEFNLDEEDDEGLIDMDLEIISDDNQKPQANSMYFLHHSIASWVFYYHLYQSNEEGDFVSNC